MIRANTTEKISRRWEVLQDTLYNLRPIHNKHNYNTALNAAGGLAGQEKLNAVEQDYLKVLSMLIGDYEEQRFKIDTSGIGPVEILKTLMEENDMSGSDLGRLLGDRSLGSRILSGERQLSKTHITILGDRFAVSPALFLPHITEVLKESAG